MLPLLLAGLALQSEPSALGYARAAELPHVLLFTHSAGFVHDVVKRPGPGTLAPAERIFAEVAASRFRVTCSQDVGDLAAAKLAGYDAIVFVTTGELPLAAGDREALMEWLARGGAFAGVHCATDTWYEFAPYVEMIGGTFDGHPWHEEITVRVEDAAHPAAGGLAQPFAITDEIYQFRNFRRDPLRVLMTLDPASVDVKLGKRADGDYALAWTRDWGEGRVFYTALGHREEVWSDARFQGHLLAGIDWALRGPDRPAPPPRGARVLLGESAELSAWTQRGGGEARWKPVEGALEVVAGAGDLVTLEAFGDGLYHVEFLTPSMPEATGQARGNSGVYLQGRYEVQGVRPLNVRRKRHMPVLIYFFLNARFAVVVQANCPVTARRRIRIKSFDRKPILIDGRHGPLFKLPRRMNERFPIVFADISKQKNFYFSAGGLPAE
jgi:type 1 glutamine amidotransferase